MSHQLTIPFGISPGCKPYYSEFLHIQKEMCQGGLVFPIGKKKNCNECAKLCSGCVEMAINLGYADFNDLKHLIRKPQMLSPKFWNLWILYRMSKQGKQISNIE